MATNTLSDPQQKCIFCRIANNQEPNTRILLEKDGVVVFKDIRPAAEHHYLVVPRKHIKDPKHLGHTDAELVKKLVSVGEEYLLQERKDISDSRLGFHWPPFNSISHLHLHVIAPVRSMGFVSSFIYRPNSPWFVTADWLLERLENMNT